LDEKYNLPLSSDISNLVKYFQDKGKYISQNPKSTGKLLFTPVECVSCLRCARACKNLQNIQAISQGPWKIDTSKCISCGQCTAVCPSHGLTEVSSIPSFLQALAAGKILCLQIAPSVRVSIAECCGEPIGTISTGKIIKVARSMGFKYVFDTNFGADVTIIEEGTELINRLTQQGILPMFTSCCPAWVNFVQKHHPELSPNLSTVKSPHMIVGNLIKHYFAEVKHLDPENLFVVSLMSCVAKKMKLKKHLVT
jgi:iron only hydrogenase large subunit-like protein